MFVVLYTVNLYILCVYDLLHILLSSRHTNGSMECMYVCKYSPNPQPGQFSTHDDILLL
jgi:hypothetical protein